MKMIDCRKCKLTTYMKYMNALNSVELHCIYIIQRKSKQQCSTILAMLTQNKKTVTKYDGVKGVGLGYGRQPYFRCFLKYMIICAFANFPSIPSFLVTKIAYTGYGQ